MTLNGANPSASTTDTVNGPVRWNDADGVEMFIRQLGCGESRASGFATRALRRGQHLYRPGDLSKHVYSIKRGMLKTYVTDANGRERITGFHLAGKLLGLDALMEHPMRGGAAALNVVVVCTVSVQSVIAASRESRLLQLQLFEQFRSEILHLESQLSTCSCSAPQRLAAFILRVTAELTEVNLPMSHKEIGNYLDLVPETVSRVFAKFQHCGWLSGRGRNMVILDRTALAQIAARETRDPKRKTLPRSFVSR